MANRFGIPGEVEAAIRERDKACVYCGRQMQLHQGVRGSPPDKATIEHLDEHPPFFWDDGLKADGIVICCGSCNSSRGTKSHEQWFLSKYCIERNINADTVAEPVKAYLWKQQPWWRRILRKTSS
ncbi:MAG: hypothetical protein AB7E70_03020 [Hyphomicrobiaceae bacterium]